jgi:hypothetical protein
MSATGAADGPGDFKEYTSGSDSTTWAAPNLADWVQVIGSGNAVVTTEAGNNRTITCDSAEPAAVLRCKLKALVSMTATRVRIGIGSPPPIVVPASAVGATSSALGGVELAGGLGGAGSSATSPVLALGTSLQTGVLPGPNSQAFADGGTAATAGFTAAVGTRYKLNPSGATFAVTFPAISSTNDGQEILLANVATAGSTATVVAPTGSDNVGNVSSGTGATVAGPVRGKANLYVADNTLKAWLVIASA